MGDASSVSELSEDLEVTHEEHFQKVVLSDNAESFLLAKGGGGGGGVDFTETTRHHHSRRRRSTSSSSSKRKVVHRLSKIMMNQGSIGSISNSTGGDNAGGIGTTTTTPNSPTDSSNRNKHRHGGGGGGAVGVTSFLAAAAPSLLLDRKQRSNTTSSHESNHNDTAIRKGVSTRRQQQKQQHQQSPKQQQQQRFTPPRGNSSRRVGDNSSHASSSCGGGTSGADGTTGGGSSIDETGGGGSSSGGGTGAGDKSIGVSSMEGLRSVVSNQTISSHDTVKASNQQQQQQRMQNAAGFRRKQQQQQRANGGGGGGNFNSDSSQSTSSNHRGGFGGGAAGGHFDEASFLLPSVGEEVIEITTTSGNSNSNNRSLSTKKRWGNKLKRALGVNNKSSCSLAGVSTMTGTAASAAAASEPPDIHDNHYQHHHHHHQHFCMNLTKFVLPSRRHHAAADDTGGGGKKTSVASAFIMGMTRARSLRNASNNGSEIMVETMVDNGKTGAAAVVADLTRARLDPVTTTSASLWTTTRMDLAKLDESIRGRMDGMDVMSLGSAMLFTPTATCISNNSSSALIMTTAEPTPATKTTTTTHPWSILPIHYSFAGNPTDYSPSQMVTDMLRSSGGRSPPEMILEGFLPGGDDRWSVRIEEEEQQQQKHQPHYQQESLQPCHELLQPSLTGTTTSSNGTATACGCGDSTTTNIVQGATSASAKPGVPVPTVPCCDPSADCLGSDGHCSRSVEDPPLMKRMMTTTTTDEYATLEDGSPAMPTHKLWSTLWGSDPAPSNNSKVLEEMNKSVDDLENAHALDDPLLHLAAESSIPIDIDEDTFIVSTREHLLAIQEIATVPLSIGRFESALRVYEKLCKGLDLSVNEECRFLRGSGRHNVGLVHMWMGNFQDALDSLSRAEADRLQFLPRQHPDVAVTQARKAQALVALERFDEALDSLEKALVLTAADQVVRAKVLSNCGVVYFLKGESFHALKCFTSALEIQRKWLETGPVVRESIVFDASVSLGNMGKLYSQQEIADFDMAAKVYKEALLLQCNIYRPNDPVVLTSAQNYAMAKSRCVSKSNNGRRAAIRLLQTCLRLQQGVGIKNLRGVENDDDEEDTNLPPLRLQQPLANAAIVETVGRLAYMYAQQAMYENALLCFEAVQQWQTSNLDATTCPNAAALLSATRANIDALRVKTTKTPSQRLDESIILATTCCGGVGGEGPGHNDKAHAMSDDDVWV